MTVADDPVPASATGDPPLPGVERIDAALAARLEQALAAKSPDYEARTRHRTPDGQPRFTNRLILESSPYLLQHAHNPVSWHPWSDVPFERARRENKPVLLSIGYSTCHWCHVMERESFEDEEIAAYLNAHFICIKVDREERPDVDDLYMKAVQMLTGRGGWPMTTVLTPNRQPFFGGTYFPARDGDRGAKKGFLTILKELRTAFDEDPAAVVRQAARISMQIAALGGAAPADDVPGADAIERAVQALERSYDPTWGGFGGAPKFPTPVNLELLMRYSRRTGDESARTMALDTLRKMAAGGIYDHIGGGFHRYATDARWLVPHFEKMLYDNAQLVAVYLDGYQLSGDPELARVAREVLDYVLKEMTSERGGFFSATDADSPVPGEEHEEEGWFFTWTPAEIEAALGPELARVVSTVYGASARGNFEGRNILHLPRPPAERAESLELSASELNDALERARRGLYAARLRRPPPILDDKIITAWNGLMISAFARGALVLTRDDYARAAARAARFVLSEMRDAEGRLRRTWVAGRAHHDAVLEDYAFFVQGLLDLYEATWEQRWLEEALALQEVQERRHGDPEAGGYFMSAADREDLLARDKPTYDGAMPSGNAVALSNLLRLDALTGDSTFRQRAERGFQALAGRVKRPRGAARLQGALEAYLDTTREVVIVAPRDPEQAEPLLAVVRRTYLPNRTLTVTTEGAALERRAELIPGLEGKHAIGDMVTAFVCERGRCERPTSDPNVLKEQLAKVKPLGLR